MSPRNRLGWTLARARAMSAGEAAWRVRQALAAQGERLLLWVRPAGGGGPLPAADGGAGSGEALLFGAQPFRYLPWEGPGRGDLARALAPLLPATAAGDPAAAEAESLDWNRDPVTGRTFPLAHRTAIDYRRPEDEAAIRRLWYRARHRDLAAGALPYYLAGEERAAARSALAIRSWIEQCPPYRGVHWLVPLELALRLIAWSTAARLLAGSTPLAALAPALARSVHLQAEHVLANLSRFSSANNHLMAQGAGLVHAGVAFCGLRRADVWRETGREILWSEILRQTTPDGVSREASLHYHEFVLELVILVWLLLKANGEEPPPTAKERIAAMLDFVAEMESFPGGAPAIGDSDDQSVLPLGGAGSPRRSLLALGAVLFGRVDWKEVAGEMPPSAAFLLGEEGRSRWADLIAGRAPARTSRLFPDAGYALLRDAGGDRALFLDAGDLGYLSTAAHGHADCLAIVLGAFGEPLLVDPGTYTYHADPEFRAFFRSTAAHNTVRVDGTEQSEMQGAFLWGRRAHGRIVHWGSSAAADLVIGEHDGYSRLAMPVGHRRRLVFVKPDYVWMIDELSGSAEHLIESFLHFAPGMCVDVSGPAEVLVRTRAGAALHVRLLGAPLPEMDWLAGSMRPLQGWVSPAFGRREPAPVLRLVSARQLPAALHLLLQPRGRADMAGNARETAAVQALTAGHVLSVRGRLGEDLVAVGGGRGEVGGTGELAGEVDLAGGFGLVRLGPGGLVAAAGQGLSRFTAGNRVLAEAGGGAVDFSFRRLGEHAVVEGRGGRLRLWAPGVLDVRRNGRVLPVRHSGEWIELDLGPVP